MLNYIKAEFLKLKRSKLLLMVLLGTIAPAGLMSAILVFGDVGPQTMEYFLNDINFYGLILFNVIIYAMLASYMIVMEYNDHTIKSVLTVPISRNKFILVKFLAFEIIVILLSLLNYFVSVALGYLAGNTDITVNLLGNQFVQFLGGNFLLSIVLTPFIFISLLFKNVIPTVICGVVVSFSSSIIYNSQYAPLSPFTLPILIIKKTLDSYNYGVVTPGAIFIITCIVGLIVSMIYFNKTDVSL